MYLYGMTHSRVLMQCWGLPTRSKTRQNRQNPLKLPLANCFQQPPATATTNNKLQTRNNKQPTNLPTYQPINRRTTTNTTTIPTPAATPQPQQPQLQLLQPSKIQTASTCTRTSTPSSKPLFHYKKLSTRIKKLSMASPIFVVVAFWFQKIDMKFEIQISELLTALGPAATPQLCQATGDPNPERWSLAQRQVREKGLPLASATVAPGRSGLFITYIYI